MSVSYFQKGLIQLGDVHKWLLRVDWDKPPLHSLVLRQQPELGIFPEPFAGQLPFHPKAPLHGHADPQVHLAGIGEHHQTMHGLTAEPAAAANSLS